MHLNFPNGIGRNISSNRYPLMSSSAIGNGLEISMQQSKQHLNKFEACAAPAFVVHSPFELAGSYDQNERIDFYYEYNLEVLITPEIIKTDESLRSFKPKARGCYFQGEKTLKFFRIYTRRNCEFECYAKHFIRKLNCVPFFMVRNETTEVCGIQRAFDVELEFYRALRNAESCQCLDECDSVKYRIEVIAHSENDVQSSAHNSSDVFVSMQFKFKDLLIAPLRRYQPFTFTEFLAQSGGMMGLFAGISALSIIELCYFMTLRWALDFGRWLMNKWNK
jgi:amiloride-sensitive sodium channel